MERKVSMYSTKMLNNFGICLLFIFVIIIQLVWLFDPIRVGGLYWLDLLNYALYFILIIPLLWFINALLNGGYMYEQHKIIKAQTASHSRLFILLFYVSFIIKGIIFLSSSTAIMLILSNAQPLVPIAISIAVALVLILVDVVIEEYVYRRQVPVKGLCILVACSVIGAFLLFPTSHTVTYPGLTMNMNQFAQVDGGQSKGEIMGVLIFERPAFPVDWMYAYLFPHYEIRERRITDLPVTEQLQRVRSMKLDANKVASAVAFHRVGLGRGITYQGLLITELFSDTPAADQLQIGDIIVNIDGYAVHSVHEYMDHMQNIQPGNEIQLTIMRSAEEIVFVAETVYSPEDMSQAMLGVQVTNSIHYDIPNEVNYYSYLLHEGGPSHGAILALTLINQLSPYGVTNGNVVAGTGTINADGSIGRVGGVKQKAYSVERAGADVFFVPSSQYKQALEGSTSLNIVPVDTLAEILEWLERNPKH